VTADTGVDTDESLEHDPPPVAIIIWEPPLPCALPCSLPGEPFTVVPYFNPLFIDPALFFVNSNFSDGFLILDPVILGDWAFPDNEEPAGETGSDPTELLKLLVPTTVKLGNDNVGIESLLA